MDPAKRTKYIIAALSLVVIVVAIYFLFIYKKAPKEIEIRKSSEEVEELFKVDIGKRPYVALTPTSDGAEIIISIENMSYFDKIEYELTYLADNPQIAGEKLERGSTGTDINTHDAKYKKSILLGTASRGVRSPDRGIGDGKLTMHMFKGSIEYQSETSWNLLEVGAKPGIIIDNKNNFEMKTGPFGKDYWVIIADTIGVPNGGDFDLKKVILPVYGTFSIAPSFAKAADVSIKINGEGSGFLLYSYDDKEGKWQKLEGKYNPENKSISATISNFATFVVVSAK